MFPSRLAFLSLVLLLTACAPTRQLVSISPNVAAPEQAAATSLVISLTVEDERGDPLLGNRGDVILYTNQDIKALLQNTLTSAFAARRVQVVAGESSRTLTVLIKSLKLEAGGGIWTAKAELATVAKNGSSEYKANYRMEKDKKGLLNPGAQEVEQILNELLNDALAKLVNDANLMAFLNK